VTNPERIISALDTHLDHEVTLILYGRGAIALGFQNPPEAASLTLDVDCIIPVSRLVAFHDDANFWDAQDLANRELKKHGLYITHLFRDDEVFLRRSWENHLVPVTRPPTRRLRLFRPATIDLILTKMMRGEDEQDLNDIAFLIRHDRVRRQEIEEAFAEAVIPDMVELRDAFERAKPLVRALARPDGAEAP
jgi:hypothetical protein